MKLILARHGETIENRLHILQGQTPGLLTAKGVSQTNKLADLLLDFNIALCFTSDLRRAVDTANIIAAKHPRMTVIEDVRLRERYLGDLQGKAIPDNWNGTNHHEGAESMPELFARVKDFADYLQANHSDETVLIISHGITLKALMSALDESEREEFGNGSYSVVIR
ncbi:MAG: histidine phosphatase family protein [Prevotellaceae bacterium]|jgi:broad specificity phosphatase PhoE|nr:histidine phosphatase family protein [Prevotellaceae bacterium]